MGAMAIGVGVTLVSYCACTFLKPAFGYDDSLDVFGVHALGGAWGALASGIFATTLFSWYLQRYADYSILYGSLGVGIALLVWMYMISLVVLVGAEFNAMLFPRARLGIELIFYGGAWIAVALRLRSAS